MITTYIGPKLYPGALSDCAASVLATISKSGVWIPDFSAVSYDQQKAILLLRNTGYIEMAAYVGWKVKGNMHTVASATPAQPTPAAAIAAILRDAGVSWVGEIRPYKLAFAWGPNCWCFVLPRGVVLGAAREAFKKVVVDQCLVVVELK